MTTVNRKFSLRELRAFCAAAEYESFRVAAEKLYLTASAVSHQIKNLEEQLGSKLFERGSRSVSLTPAGELLYSDVYPLIRQFDDVAARHAKNSERKTLRISVQPFFASELFVPRLSRFRERHPDIDIKVDTSDESSEKHPAGTDVSIRIFTSPPKNLVARRLFPLRLAPLGSPDFYDGVKVKASRITSDFPLLIHEARPRAWGQWERAAGVRLPRDSKTIELDSMIAVARAAERGLGAALIPVQLAESWLEESTLVYLFDTELETREAYYVVHDEASANSEHVTLFCDWVLQEFGDMR